MNIPEPVKSILKALEEHGHAAHCVGGCVRDSLLGREPGDWDVATSALPEETMALFPGRAAPTGLRHGTVTVREGALPVEVTTFRTDGRYTDGRHPDSVAFTRSLRDDLSRRDFTVNAMGLDLRGTLTDPFGGQEDLKNRLLRCVGSPEGRFQEDALRILRGLRLAAVLGFSVEEETARALRACRKLLCGVAAERIQIEMTKLLCGPAAAEVLRGFSEVVGTVVPELLPMVGFDQHSRYHCYDVWEHTLHALSEVPAEPVLRWAVLLHDVAKPRCYTRDERGGHFYGHPTVSAGMADAILRRLKFYNATREPDGEKYPPRAAKAGGGAPAGADRGETGGQSGAGPRVPGTAAGCGADTKDHGESAGPGRMRITAAVGGERTGYAGAGPSGAGDRHDTGRAFIRRGGRRLAEPAFRTAACGRESGNRAE